MNEGEEITTMGVGKNTTSKTLDSSSEGGKYEEESKHGADFYPIPVRLDGGLVSVDKIFQLLPYY